MSRNHLILAAALVCIASWPGKGQEPDATPRWKGQNDQPSGKPSSDAFNDNVPRSHFTLATSAPEPLLATSPNFTQAIPPNPEPKNDLERETTDAEKSMAQSNVWIAIASIVQTAVAVVGGVIIWLTLKATQSAAREAKRSTDALIVSNTHLDASNIAAREAHNAERRPWLSLSIRLDKEGIRRHEPGEGFYRLRVYPTVTNHGSTPATGVFFEFHIAFGCDEKQAINNLKLHEDCMDYRPSWQEHEFQAVFPGETRVLPEHPGLIDQLDIDQALRGHMTASAWIGAFVHYESQHSGTRHTSLIGRLTLVHPQHEKLRFEIVERFNGWAGRELNMDIVSSSAG